MQGLLGTARVATSFDLRDPHISGEAFGHLPHAKCFMRQKQQCSGCWGACRFTFRRVGCTPHGIRILLGVWVHVWKAY